jgi:hypothetical protein
MKEFFESLSHVVWAHIEQMLQLIHCSPTMKSVKASAQYSSTFSPEDAGNMFFQTSVLT